MAKPLFDLGQLVATPGALSFMEKNEINSLILLGRHITGDWGDLCDEDTEQNNLALNLGGPLMSVYKFDQGDVWIITEHDRSATTFLLPSEY